MANSLMPVGEPGDLPDIARSIREFVEHEDADSRAVLENHLMRRPGLLERAFPGQRGRALNKIDAERLLATADAKSRMLRLYNDVQYDVERGKADALIKAEGIDNQQRLADFASAKLLQLQENLAQTTESAVVSFERQQAFAESKKDNPVIYAALQDQLEKSMGVFFTTCDSLREGFQTALANRLPSS